MESPARGAWVDLWDVTLDSNICGAAPQRQHHELILVINYQLFIYLFYLFYVNITWAIAMVTIVMHKN